MSGSDPVGVNSQDARIEWSEDDQLEDVAKKANAALLLIRDDIQRLSALVTKNVTRAYSSGGFRLPSPSGGIADIWAVSDTASAGSTGANYHVLALRRNGVAVGTMTYDTRRVEVSAFGGGCYLGQVAVSEGDLLSVSVTVTGAPAPTLSTANFCLRCQIRGK